MNDSYGREMEWGQVVAYNGDGTCKFLVDGRDEPYDNVPIHNLSLQGGRCAIVFYNKQRNLPHVFSNSPKTRKPGVVPSTPATDDWRFYERDYDRNCWNEAYAVPPEGVINNITIRDVDGLDLPSGFRIEFVNRADGFWYIIGYVFDMNTFTSVYTLYKCVDVSDFVIQAQAKLLLTNPVAGGLNGIATGTGPYYCSDGFMYCMMNVFVTSTTYNVRIFKLDCSDLTYVVGPRLDTPETDIELTLAGNKGIIAPDGEYVYHFIFRRKLAGSNKKTITLCRHKKSDLSFDQDLVLYPRTEVCSSATPTHADWVDTHTAIMQYSASGINYVVNGDRLFISIKDTEIRQAKTEVEGLSSSDSNEVAWAQEKTEYTVKHYASSSQSCSSTPPTHNFTVWSGSDYTETSWFPTKYWGLKAVKLYPPTRGATPTGFYSPTAGGYDMFSKFSAPYSLSGSPRVKYENSHMMCVDMTNLSVLWEKMGFEDEIEWTAFGRIVRIPKKITTVLPLYSVGGNLMAQKMVFEFDTFSSNYAHSVLEELYKGTKPDGITPQTVKTGVNHWPGSPYLTHLTQTIKPNSFVKLFTVDIHYIKSIKCYNTLLNIADGAEVWSKELSDSADKFGDVSFQTSCSRNISGDIAMATAVQSTTFPALSYSFPENRNDAPNKKRTGFFDGTNFVVSPSDSYDRSTSDNGEKTWNNTSNYTVSETLKAFGYPGDSGYVDPSQYITVPPGPHSDYSYFESEVSSASGECDAQKFLVDGASVRYFAVVAPDTGNILRKKKRAWELVSPSSFGAFLNTFVGAGKYMVYNDIVARRGTSPSYEYNVFLRFVDTDTGNVVASCDLGWTAYVYSNYYVSEIMAVANGAVYAVKSYKLVKIT